MEEEEEGEKKFLYEINQWGFILKKHNLYC